MQTVRIVCPKCQTALNVSNINNEATRLISCPQCHTQLRITFPPQASQPAPPVAPAGDEGATVIGSPRLSTVVYALECQGQVYPLADGLNTVGRKATTSKATVQIDTLDHKMSRHHATLQLLRLPGGVVKLKVSNWQNKNGTWVGDTPLGDGETLFLEPGNTLTLGATTLTVVTR